MPWRPCLRVKQRRYSDWRLITKNLATIILAFDNDLRYVIRQIYDKVKMI